MKKIYTLITLILLINTAFSQLVMEWQKSFGGSDSDDAYSFQITNDGGFVIAGFTDSNDGDVTGNHGYSDVWIVKIDSLLNIQWQKCFGGSWFDQAWSIKQTFDNGYILFGNTDSNDGDVTVNKGFTDYWIIKLDSMGNLQWQKTYGGSFVDHGISVYQTNDFGFILAGNTLSSDGDVTINYGYSDYWVIKVDSTGNLDWQKSFGGSGADIPSSIKQTTDGGFIIAGSSYSNDGDVTGNHGNMDAWILKLENNGNIQWQKSLGGSNDEGMGFIDQTLDGGYLTVGRTMSNDGDVSGNHGDYDGWVFKLDSAGNIQWQKCIGGSGYDVITGFTAFQDGGWLLSAVSNSNDGDVSYNKGDFDNWLVRIDSIGNIIWEQTFGGSNWDAVFGVHKYTNNSYIIAGHTNSNNGDISGNNGSYDFWISKITTNYNKMIGKSFIDINSNSSQDINENILNGHVIYETGSGRISITKFDGTYELPVLDTGSFNVAPYQLLYYGYFPVNHTANFSGINQTDSLNDFAFQPYGVFNDLQITISPIGPFRPGFNAYYKIHYKNIGTTALAGTVIFAPDSNITFVSASLTPNVINTDSIYWNLPVLNPFDEGDILVIVQVDVNSVLGSITNSGTKIEPVTGDAYPGNNQAWWEVEVTGSFDPNDILVNKETITTTELANSTYLEYLIRFQNTGTDTAFTVKIMNNITEMLDVSTFEFVNSSHPVEINYGNHSRLFEFRFDNILLPDSNTNVLLSHGFVRYRIKPLDILSVGNIIENTAAIYFDFNAPVITNTAETEVVLPISIPHIKNNHNLSLYPNPATSELNVSFNLDKASHVNLQLFNSLGQLVKTITNEKLNAGENKLNFSTGNIPPGIYHLKFSVDGNEIARKVVKMQ